MLAKYDDYDVFDELFRSIGFGSTRRGSPPANVIERQGGYDIRLLVPGYSKSDIKLAVQSNMIKISGDKSSSDERLLHREFSTTKFERSFSLPNTVNKDSITARCEDGVLTVSIPLKEKEQAKLLEIEVK